MVTELPRIQSLSVLCVADIHNEQSTKAWDGELGCLCGKAGTSDGSAHSSGCVVNGYGCLLIITLMHPYSYILLQRRCDRFSGYVTIM